MESQGLFAYQRWSVFVRVRHFSYSILAGQLQQYRCRRIPLELKAIKVKNSLPTQRCVLTAKWVQRCICNEFVWWRTSIENKWKEKNVECNLCMWYWKLKLWLHGCRKQQPLECKFIYFHDLHEQQFSLYVDKLDCKYMNNF